MFYRIVIFTLDKLRALKGRGLINTKAKGVGGTKLSSLPQFNRNSPDRSLIILDLSCRENDQYPLDLDHPFCARILKAAEGVPYVDFRDVADMYDADADVSTPDHTTNSEPDIQNSHLAEQEGAFSEDNFNMSTPDSLPHDGTMVAIEMQEAEIFPYDNEEEREESLVYHEPEADNSCVLEVDQSEDTPNSEYESDQDDDVDVEIPMRANMADSS